MPLQHDMTIARYFPEPRPLAPLPWPPWSDVIVEPRPKKGDHFKWCGCRAFRDFCTHMWRIPVIVAFGCSYLINRESRKEEVRCIVLFTAGFLCAAAMWSPNFFFGILD